jgi:hypothetical protein
MLFLLQNQEALSHILEALYEAPLDPSRWEEFVCLTAETAGGIPVPFSGPQNSLVNLLCANLRPDYIASVSLRSGWSWGQDPFHTRFRLHPP